MRKLEKLFDLQFFGGEGGAAGGDGGGEGSGVTAAAAGQPGVNTAAAGQTGLEDLGVPKAMAERHRARMSKRSSQAAEPAQVEMTAPKGSEAQTEGQSTTEQAAAAPETSATQPKSLNWDELMKDPEINRQMRQTVSARVNEFKAKLTALNPAMELLGKKYGIDTSDMGKFDYESLAKAVQDDESLYESAAREMGVTRSIAKNVVQREQRAAAIERAATESFQEQMMRQHFEDLERQAASLREEFPDLDLNAEMQDPRFANMLRAGSPWSVEQAYMAIHGREIAQRRAQSAAQQAAQALSRSVQSGGQLPRENGLSNTGAQPVEPKLYSQMNREERAAYKAQLQREARLRR